MVKSNTVSISVGKAPSKVSSISLSISPSSGDTATLFSHSISVKDQYGANMPGVELWLFSNGVGQGKIGTVRTFDAKYPEGTNSVYVSDNSSGT